MAKVLLTGTPSDAHTWNLAFLELWLTERGHEVTNLGSAVAADLLTRTVSEEAPDALVISSINGHGLIEGPLIAGWLAEAPLEKRPMLVIGGLLSTTGDEPESVEALLKAVGFDSVLIGEDGLEILEELLGAISKRDEHRTRRRNWRI